MSSPQQVDGIYVEYDDNQAKMLRYWEFMDAVN